MEIELTQGKTAVIDDADWPLIREYTWHAKKEYGRWYVTAYADDKTRTLRIHRLLLNAPKGMMVDHINGNTLDNRRCNLRLCTNAENQQNSSGRRGSSKFKGVSWMKSKQRWYVAFNWNGKTHFVGYFKDEVEAAKAYNEAIKPLAGEFCRLNAV